MEAQAIKNIAKTGAYAALIGSLCMLSGAAMLAISGADMDLALETNDISGYLTAVGNNRILLIINLSLWIFGVIILGAAATMMISLGRQRIVLSKLAQYNYQVAIPIVVISYVAWMTVILPVSGNTSEEVAFLTESIGWFATRADWVATILVLGIGPVLISLAGRNIWVPKWLLKWSYTALVSGILTILALYIGGMTTFGFTIIPVGMGWMVASSVVLFRIKK